MGFDGSGIDGLLSAAVADGVFTGVVAMVVDRDGILYEGSAGAAGSDTIFRNASMTKALATTGALQLLEQGRIDLDQTVESILPEFGELQVLDGYDGDTPILNPPASKATIRQLMTHTAGCGYSFTNADLHRFCTETGFPEPFTGLKQSLSAPMTKHPGTMWDYGVNTDWLGLVVEKVSGQSLSTYLAEHLFGPLGMTDTTFAPTDEQRGRVLELTHRGPDGDLEPVDMDLPTDPEWDAAGHGSYGTARDYARFIRTMLNDGELDGTRVLQADTVTLAFSDHIEGIPMPEVMYSADPMLSLDVPAPPVPQGWGLGFHLMKVDLPGMRSNGTGGWSGLFNTYYWIDRAAGVGAVIMTQVLPFFDPKIVETVLGFELAVYAEVGAAAAA